MPHYGVKKIFEGEFLKFIYCEKTTKFCGIYTLLLTVCAVVKSKGKILQNFVVFSEYMNFNNMGSPSFLCKQEIFFFAKILNRMFRTKDEYISMHFTFFVLSTSQNILDYFIKEKKQSYHARTLLKVYCTRYYKSIIKLRSNLN